MQANKQDIREEFYLDNKSEKTGEDQKWRTGQKLEIEKLVVAYKFVI